ncbi:FecR family protein [Agrobacterium sp. rho-13.3]|uniref:FecR family protein n=1 Tax=Agrobacterium sp. rho-13.3 TaxID=3072980 RepID=UPI002A0D0138|nr:FecR family protein [Agrobacterium sp. rho-13.3]MDX8306324.1 FecR family protein [Agrobacterium sp. rho-13.3]MDX8307345.1 FecR family protein [Agrobacterium sp. rho-13.3]
MTSDQDSQRMQAIADEAADWLIRIRENPDLQGLRAEFESWVLASPQHRREWEKTCRMWRAVGEIPQDQQNRSSVPVRSRRKWMSRAVGAVGAAVITICLVALAAPTLLLRFEADYTTATAQTREVVLADGSKVFLSPASALAVDFSSGERKVRLLEGEAYFDVAPDTTKPFRVEAGKLTVAVLGTAFNVSLTGENTQIGLEHGSVKATGEVAGAVIDRVLVPGELLTVDRSTGAISDEMIGVAGIGAWRTGRLIVTNEKIGTVIEQIQRYHPAWISTPDISLSQQRVSGIYNLDDPEKALGALVDPYGGKVRKVSDFARIVTRF